MLGFSLGPGNGYQGNPGSGPPVELRAVFGNLTKPGAGGMPVSGLSIVAGDPQGHWEILAGRIAPTAGGAAAGLDQGPYVLTMDNGRVVEITIEPDAYTVANAAEFQAISTAEAFGRTIRVREGAQIDWGPGLGPGDRASLGFATIMGDGNARAVAAIGGTGHFAAIHPRNVSDVTLKNLRIRKIDYGIDEASGPVSNLTVQECLIMNTDVLDLNGDYSAPGAVAALGLSSGISLTGYVHGLRLIDNDIRNVSHGINAKFRDWGEIIGNRIDGFYNDAIRIVKRDPDTPVIIAGNSISRPFNKSGDADDPHTDGIQFLGYNAGGGATIPDDSPNNVIEANSFSIGNTRSNWQAPEPVSGYSAGIFAKDIVPGKGFGILIRGNMFMKTGYEDIRPQSVKNARVEYNGSIPRDVAEADGGKFDIGETFATGSNSASNNIARAVNALNGTAGSGNIEVASNAAAWDAVLPNWRLPVQDRYDLPTILGAFQGATGAAAGKGPAAMVSLAGGADLSAYQMDPALVPVPVLTNPLASGAGGTLSLAVSTNVDLNPIFWAVVPVGQAASLREIKERRVPNALEYGHTAVEAAGNVTITGTVAHPPGDYEVIYFQENGWTRQSPVYRTAWTAESATVDLSAGGSARFAQYNNEVFPARVSPVLSGAYTLPMDPAQQSNFFADGEDAFVILRFPRHARRNIDINAQWGIFGNNRDSWGYRLSLYDGEAGLTDRRHKFLGWYRGHGIAGGVNVFSAPWEGDEALVVFSRRGDNYAIDIYDLGTGTKHPGPVVTATTYLSIINVNGIGVGAVAAIDTATKDVTGFSGAGFPGEISMFGHTLPGAAATDADWIAIAQGADPVAQLGAGNFRWLRKLDGSAASLAPVAGVTSDTTGTMIPGLAGTGTEVKAGSHLVRKAQNTYLDVDRWQDGIVYGLKPGATTQAVPFSGKAAGLTGNVEVRTLYTDGTVHQDWTTVGPISGGAWSGAVQLPKSDQGWLVAQFRATSDPTNITDVRAEFGVGYVIGLMGQSQVNIATHSTARGDTLTTLNDVSYIESLQTVNPDATEGWKNLIARGAPWQQADGLTYFVRQLRRFDAKTPIMVMNMALSGSDLDALLDDAVASRKWARLQSKLDEFTNAVSVVVMNWGTTMNAYTAQKNRDLVEALVLGTGPEYTGNSLKDSLEAGFAFVVSPLTRHSDGTYDTPRRAQIEWANANGVQVGPPLPDYRIENAGGPHPDSTSLKGNTLLLARMAVGAAQALGLSNVQNPHYDAGGVVRSGNTITIPVVAQNGGTLSSATPNALTNWRVNGSSAGFNATLSGSNVVLTKASGTWAAGDVVEYLENGETRAGGDGAAEDQIVNGVLYEAWADDVLGLGLPVVGSLDAGGKWQSQFRVVV